MKFFKNRAVAVLLAIIVVAGSIFANTFIRLTEECQKVEDGFYTSDTGSKNIYAYLGSRLDASNGLWTILINHDAEAAASLNQARSALLDAYDNRDISDMYGANSELEKAFNEAMSVISGYTLTSLESDALNDYTIIFDGAQRMIDQNSYNSGVLEFMRTTYNKFPAVLLASLLGVQAPELYD
ncbi:MAG: hypothetical protein EOM54_03325 [Clostridia bacterium]|nr:hypothetical protein [Clostridia bacterium]